MERTDIEAQKSGQLTIDFDKLAEVGIKGVRRAAVFMGLGLNAAYDPAFKSYQLGAGRNIPSSPINIQLVPANVDDKTLGHFKQEFGIWIVANGLREVIERFAVFLDGVHHVCQWIAVSKQKFDPAEAERLHGSFSFKGIEGKLRHLETRFRVKPNQSDYIVSIHKARNCLTHRLGKVSVGDCNSNHALEVKWLGMEIQIQLESGKILPIDEAIGVVLPEPGSLQLKIVERRKSFPLGTFALFEKHELEEICQFMLGSIGEVTKTAVTYAVNAGVQLQQPSPA